MFDSLSSKLQNAFKNLRGLGKISESNIGDALREVRMALLEADVNFKVARDFIERVKTKSLGAEVISTVQPGQQIIKIVSDELTDLLGSQNAALNLDGNPSCLMLVGLHGSGKTTSSGKLAKLLKKQGRSPLLVAADVYRPAPRATANAPVFSIASRACRWKSFSPRRANRPSKCSSAGRSNSAPRFVSRAIP